jgi:hypothetical protein
MRSVRPEEVTKAEGGGKLLSVRMLAWFAAACCGLDSRVSTTPPLVSTRNHTWHSLVI